MKLLIHWLAQAILSHHVLAMSSSLLIVLPYVLGKHPHKTQPSKIHSLLRILEFCYTLANCNSWFFTANKELSCAGQDHLAL